MAKTKIDELCLINYDLSHSLKSFFNELADHEMQSIKGGQTTIGGAVLPAPVPVPAPAPAPTGIGGAVLPAPVPAPIPAPTGIGGRL